MIEKKIKQGWKQYSLSGQEALRNTHTKCAVCICPKELRVCRVNASFCPRLNTIKRD